MALQAHTFRLLAYPLNSTIFSQSAHFIPGFTRGISYPASFFATDPAWSCSRVVVGFQDLDVERSGFNWMRVSVGHVNAKSRVKER
jgi:hypothetical protein